jgi:uncharacterized protein GlcG (DUF336 family)
VSNLSLNLADRIVSEALASARRQNLRPMAVVVVDAAGHLKYLAREDGASSLRVDIAHGKAAAAFGMGIASRTLHERAATNPVFFNAVAAATDSKFIPHTGAVVILSPDGVVLGAVGASGGTGDEDEAICIDGIRAVELSYR